MTKVKAVIIDDQQVNVDTLQELILRFCPGTSIVGTAKTVTEAYSIIANTAPDLIFLDIELGQGNGFDLLRMFPDPAFKIVFTTAYAQYAVEAFREHAVDYLLKPIQITQLQEAIRKVESVVKLRSEKQPVKDSVLPAAKVSLPTSDGYLFVDYNDIIYCEAEGSYSTFYFTDKKKILVSLLLKECEGILPHQVFLRIHNSYIVNINHVAKYIRGKGGQIVMNSGVELSVSASRKEQFLTLMNGRYQR